MAESKVEDKSELFREITALIVARDARGGELLDKHFRRGLSYLAARISPDIIDDSIQETFLVVLKNIEAGELKAPEALPGYVRNIHHRICWGMLHANKKHQSQDELEEAAKYQSSKDLSPEKQFELAQQREFIKKGLAALSERDREILRRFYMLEQPREQIEVDLKMTETQFRLAKSRAKAKVAQVVQAMTDEHKRLSKAKDTKATASFPAMLLHPQAA